MAINFPNSPTIRDQFTFAGRTYEWTGTYWRVLIAKGADGREVEIQNSGTHVQWRYAGDVSWNNLIEIASITGTDGREVEIQNSGTHIQWRYAGDVSWTTIVAVADLKGDKGDAGANAWTPVMAVESDGSRRVFKVVDWIGGGGTKPAVNVYIGASGYTANIAEAIDVRGMPGADGSGSGDMSKSTYDTNDDGKVNAAEVADSVDWSGVQNKPSTFTPSVHGHDDATTSAPGFMSASDKSKLDNVEANADVTDAQNVGTTIQGVSSKTTPADADTLPVTDSAASNVLKKLSWSNLKATLKTYFDTLYSASGHNHDERYYTETETDSLLSGKQDSLGFTPENSANKNQPSGYAGLDSGGKINPSHLPAIALTEVFQAANEVEHLAISAQEGDVVVRTDESKTYIHNGGTSGTMSDYTELANSTGGVTSFNSRTGAVTPQAGDYDLSEIDETGTYKRYTDTEKSKLSGIEANADVTDADNVGSSIHGASGKTTPVDADTLPMIDSAASNVLKKVTWANLKTTLKTYFDTLYNLTSFSTNVELLDNTVSGKAIAPSTIHNLLGYETFVFEYDNSSTNLNNSVPDGMFRLNNSTPGAATQIRFGSNDKNGRSMYRPFWIISTGSGESGAATLALKKASNGYWDVVGLAAFSSAGSNQFISTFSASSPFSAVDGDMFMFEFGFKGLSGTLASQAQAEAGTSHVQLMTPLRTAQAIAALAGSGGTYQKRAIKTGNSQVISSTSFTDVTGMSVTLEPGKTYHIQVKLFKEGGKSGPNTELRISHTNMTGNKHGVISSNNEDGTFSGSKIENVSVGSSTDFTMSASAVSGGEGSIAAEFSLLMTASGSAPVVKVQARVTSSGSGAEIYPGSHIVATEVS